MLNINYLFEIYNISYMYRSGPIQDIKIFKPRIPDKQHRDKTNNKIIYVTNDISYAAGFCFNWSDNDGFKYGKSNNEPWTLNIPTQFKNKLDNPCSMYYLNSKNAKKLDTPTPEFYYHTDVKVVKEVKFKTCVDCLNYYKVKVVFI